MGKGKGKKRGYLYTSTLVGSSILVTLSLLLLDTSGGCQGMSPPFHVPNPKGIIDNAGKREIHKQDIDRLR